MQLQISTNYRNVQLLEQLLRGCRLLDVRQIMAYFSWTQKEAIGIAGVLAKKKEFTLSPDKRILSLKDTGGFASTKPLWVYLDFRANEMADYGQIQFSDQPYLPLMFCGQENGKDYIYQLIYIPKGVGALMEDYLQKQGMAARQGFPVRRIVLLEDAAAAAEIKDIEVYLFCTVNAGGRCEYFG